MKNSNLQRFGKHWGFHLTNWAYRLVSRAVAVAKLLKPKVHGSSPNHCHQIVYGAFNQFAQDEQCWKVQIMSQILGTSVAKSDEFHLLLCWSPLFLFFLRSITSVAED